MPRIKVEQMVMQWKDAAHRLDVAVYNATIKAAEDAREIFKESIINQRFNSAGASRWAPIRKPRKTRRVSAGHYISMRGARGATHLLYETGTLYGAFRISHANFGGRGSKGKVYVDPAIIRSGGLRPHSDGKVAYYAAYHNAGQGVAKRQYLGYSTVAHRNNLKLLKLAVRQALPS